jgi:hypothetical protein
MRAIIRSAAAAALAAGLGACAAGGVSEAELDTERLTGDLYEVSYEGGAEAGRETVELALLGEAAELAMARGASHFAIVERDSDTEYVGAPLYTTPGIYGYGTGWGLGSTFSYPYYGSYPFGVGRGVGLGYPGVGAGLGTEAIYEASATVELLDGPAPGRTDVFEAASVLATLRGRTEES